MMDKDICRAITFINYHIPPVVSSESRPQYITAGFFDGMLTECLNSCHENEELKYLWKYSIKRMDKKLGQYSYQNIFCFSRNEWNEVSDESFWSEDTDSDYPLTFVVFLQLREYKSGDNAIQFQCQRFNKSIKESVGSKGVSYSYATIDKNDFVICLKCRNYGMAVRAIKNLHKTEAEIINSYSVFSVSRIVLSQLQDARYQYIFEEDVYSICLKGITNSYGLRNKVTLDQKYNEFCHKVVHELYDGREDEYDYKIYDILGDDDFRLIAREVKLGKILQLFAPGGLLCYEESSFRFYLFSSGLVINMESLSGQEKIDEEYIVKSSDEMEKEFQSLLCNRLESEMREITKIVSQENVDGNEKIVTFCHAVWQLLQSLKPLEATPGKKYDFWSLYPPFSMMVNILEEKLSKGLCSEASEKERGFIGKEEIYTFIHKISMTLHGMLRTDIQFFQIRDFNVIVHYAPAKLRAFYSLWVSRLTEYYNEFNEDDVKNKYSFILSPGMFREISVKELYLHYPETQRLMLIQVPERYLYSNKWLPVILAHEVSHFVGYASRQRMKRHLACLDCCARVMFLEINYYRYYTAQEDWQPLIECGVSSLKLFEKMKEELRREEIRIRKSEGVYPHEFHSKNSIKIITETFREVNRKYTFQFMAEDSESINKFLKNEKNIDDIEFVQQCELIQNITLRLRDEYKEILALNCKFESDLLTQILEMFIYLCKESYADLAAVLTLNLTPGDYVASFNRGDLRIDENGGQDRRGVLVVRAGLTMQAIMDMVKEKPSCLTEEFCRNWSGEVFHKNTDKFPEDSIEKHIAVDIFGFIRDIRNCNEKIGKYKAMYNYASGCFDNHLLDFLNDEVVWNGLLGYIRSCGNAYVTFLAKKEYLRERKQKLWKSYNKISGSSIVSMTQEIEDFLAEYEDEKRKEVKVEG